MALPHALPSLPVVARHRQTSTELGETGVDDLRRRILAQGRVLA
ncbi:MAG: hypothetical protein RIM84_18685 [Alphaproteobacteria bacterium]